MNKLDELLQRLCPDGVEYRTLGELGNFFGGITGKAKDDFVNGNAKFITYKNVYTNSALQLDVEDRVRIADDEKQHPLQYGDVIFTGSSETPDECGISSVLATPTREALYLNSFCFFFRFDDPKIMLPDFSKHLFRSGNLRYQIGKTASGVTRYNVSKKLMAKIVIPVPPLEVQQEIVRILDQFTQLTAELTTELAARKKQYMYYTSLLLSGVTASQPYKHVQLNNFAKFVYGFTDKAQNTGDARFLRITDIDDNGCLKESDAKYITLNRESRKYLVHQGDLLVARTGATYGKTLFVPDDTPSVYASFLIKICLDNSIMLNRFYWHFAQSHLYWKQAAKLVSAGGQPQFNSGAIGRVLVPVPPLPEQSRIVAILDRFDALCNDPTSGLPAEIAARQKQYEYYRDKLLTLPERKS